MSISRFWPVWFGRPADFFTKKGFFLISDFGSRISELDYLQAKSETLLPRSNKSEIRNSKSEIRRRRVYTIFAPWL